MSKEVKRYFVDCTRLHGGDEAQDECDVRVVLASDYDALLAERDALKKDAERYRWLREKANFVKEDAPQVVITDWTGCPAATGSWVYPQFEKLDAAIDAALQGEQP